MGQIRAKFNLETLEWNFQTVSMSHRENLLEIYVISNSEEIFIEDFASINYEVLIDGSKIIEERWPTINCFVEKMTRSVPVVEKILNTKGDEILIVNIKWNQGSNEYSGTFNYQIPRPQQPFASWNWDVSSKEFLPSVPKPTDPGYYQWDETTLSWIKKSIA
jgi:hypothetical protein